MARSASRWSIWTVLGLGPSDRLGPRDCSAARLGAGALRIVEDAPGLPKRARRSALEALLTSPTTSPQARVALHKGAQRTPDGSRREDVNGTERQCDRLRLAANIGPNWPLTCDDAAVARCHRQSALAAGCESNRAQSEPSGHRAPAFANDSRFRSRRERGPCGIGPSPLPGFGRGRRRRCRSRTPSDVRQRGRRWREPRRRFEGSYGEVQPHGA